jgi:4-hydroxy-2-oxoheptanedioate aldolase
MQAKEIVRNTVKEKLARNEIVASMTVRLVRGIEIAQIAKTAGFDMFYIDIEHSSFSLDITGQICLAALSAGITPMVRVPSNTSEYISRVLDGGALGVIAPHIGSAEEDSSVSSRLRGRLRRRRAVPPRPPRGRAWPAARRRPSRSRRR